MSVLEREILAFERDRERLEQAHVGKWVVVHDERLAGSFDDFESAAAEAVRRFGRGPYLIRQVGAPPIVLPASVLYRIDDA